MSRLLDTPQAFERVGASGTHYAVEIEAFWDDKSQGNPRVRAVIDDGGLRAFASLIEDFIPVPDGSFIGE